MEKVETALRVPVAARRAGLTTRELYAKIERGEVVAQRDKDGMVVIPVAEIDAITP